MIQNIGDALLCNFPVLHRISDIARLQCVTLGFHIKKSAHVNLTVENHFQLIYPFKLEAGMRAVVGLRAARNPVYAVARQASCSVCFYLYGVAVIFEKIAYRGIELQCRFAAREDDVAGRIIGYAAHDLVFGEFVVRLVVGVAKGTFQGYLDRSDGSAD